MSENSHGWIWLRDIVIAHASVGDDPGERRRTQAVHIDIGVWVNTAKAAASDDVADTLHWMHLSNLIEEVTLRRHYALIETLCESLASAVMEQFQVTRLRLEVRKPEALRRGMASVAIERSRADTSRLA
jgi:dihydroneopterin aldolase